MKRKFGTVLEKKLIQALKQRAAEEDRPITEIVHDALVRYFSQPPGREEAREAWERLNSKPIHISNRDLKAILEVDMWEQ